MRSRLLLTLSLVLLSVACRHASPRRLEPDHVWILVSPGAPERAALEEAGFVFSPVVNHHEGQGTASITTEFENGFLELMWRDETVPVAPGLERAAEKFRNRMMWRTSGWSPIGIGVRRTSGTPQPLPFPTWQAGADWLPPGEKIEILTPRDDTTSPSLFIPPPSLDASDQPGAVAKRKAATSLTSFSQPIGVRRITAVRLIAPERYQPIVPLLYLQRERALAPLRRGEAWAVEVTFDDGAQRRERDFRPALPLVIRF